MPSPATYLRKPVERPIAPKLEPFPLGLGESVVAVDPGLDATGIAVFHAESQRLVDTRIVTTQPKSALQTRILWLAREVHAVCRDFKARRVLIEVPAFGGVYGRHLKGNKPAGYVPRGLHEMLMATGGIIAACGTSGAVVQLVRAPRLKKLHRHLHVFAKWPHLQTSSEDVLDAVYLGYAELTLK